MTKAEIEQAQEALNSVRYGVTWKGDPRELTHTKMPEGYWVPWHVADLLLAGLKDDDQVPNARFEVQKEKGSRFAYVVDTMTNERLKRFDVLKGKDNRNGWNIAAAMASQLNADANKPMFAQVFCSQCGQEFGPGYHGFSHCEDHTEAPK